MTYTWKLNPQPNGQYTRSLPNGRVMAVAPDGTVFDSPPGTVGPGELCDLKGAALHYRPGLGLNGDMNAPIYVFFPEA